MLLKLAISALCFFSLLVYCIIAKKSFQKTLLNKKRKGIFHPFLLKIFPTQKDALLRLEPSPYDPNVLATFAADSNKIIILDMRNPESPILNLQGHGSSVNGIKWHPTKRNVLLSFGDDCQVLYWDLNSSFMEINAAGSKSPSIHGTSLETERRSGRRRIRKRRPMRRC